MPFPLLPMLIGAGAGLLKGVAIDQPRASAMRKVEAEKTRWSPWTGIQGQNVPDADIFGGVLQGGMTGASFGQGLENQEMSKGLMDDMRNYYKSNSPGSIWTQLPASNRMGMFS